MASPAARPFRRFTLRTLVVPALVAGAACHDVTEPVSTVAPPARASSVAASPAAVVVHPGDLHGWSFERDARGRADTSRHGLVNGPGTPPLGSGSAELVSRHGSADALALHSLAGTRLDQFGALRYSSFESDGDADDAPMTLELSIDYDLTDRATDDMGQLVLNAERGREDEHDDDDRLARPRVRADSQRAGQWRTRDALALRWWGTRPTVSVGGRPVRNPCVASSPCTWAELRRRFPNAGVHATAGTLRFALPRGEERRTSIDAVVIAVGAVTTTWDFEAVLPVPATPQLLTVLADVGVTGTPGESDSSRAPGSTVAYDFHAPADGRTLAVYVDGAPAPASGSLTMNGTHVVHAVLRRDLTLQPGDQPLFDAMRAVLAAADPVPAFQSLLDLAGRTYAEAGDDEGDARFQRSTAAAIDPQRDAAGLARVDAALGGHLFDVNIPPDGAGAARLAPAAPLRHRVPGRAATDVVVSRGTADPTAIVYVNGIGNVFADAAQTQAHLGFLLRRNVYAFRDPGDVVMRLFYNRNDSTQTPPRGPVACLLSSATPGELTALPRYLACRSLGWLSPVVSIIGDLRESVGIMSGKALPTSAAVVQDINALADAMRGLAESGRHVVVVPHSEGNLLTERALARLQSGGFLVRNARPHCVAVVPLASPTVHYAPLDARYLRPVQLHGDVILLAGSIGVGAESFPATATSLDTRLTADRASHGATLGVRYLRELLDGGTLHTMTSYLAADGGRDLVLAAAQDAYGACATGYITIEGPIDADYPGQSTLLLGSSAQFSASAVNGAGDSVVGKPVTWSADGTIATVTADGIANVIALGSTGWVKARIGWQSNQVSIAPWSKPPVIQSVSCTSTATRYEGSWMITGWTATIDATPSTPLAPITSYRMLLQVKRRWSNTDQFSTLVFPAPAAGTTASTIDVRISQSILMDGTPDGGQWIPTGRCIGQVGDAWGKSAEMYSP